MGKTVRRIYSAIMLVVCFTIGTSLGAPIGQSGKVTTVSGKSWLEHLHRTFDETSMGKTGRLGPPDLVQQSASPATAGNHLHTVILSGADLYRLNCRGCHGESGAGAPPEINSVINPVRATSVSAVIARMKNVGADISRADATKLAQESYSMLLQRLHNGGQDMPPFPQLSEADIRVLIGYLKELAEVPGAEQERGCVQASPLRVGELIVKSTCHTCHSAGSANPTPRELSDGAIPPLSALTSRVNRAGFIRKVTQGAPVIMGEPALLYRGRMPVFYYLSEEEAADVYQYLRAFSPEQADAPNSVMANSQSHGVAQFDPPAAAVKGDEASASAKGDSRVHDGIVLSITPLLGMLLIAGGAALTVREMRKLASMPSNSGRIPRNRPEVPVSSARRDLVA